MELGEWYYFKGGYHQAQNSHGESQCGMCLGSQVLSMCSKEKAFFSGRKTSGWDVSRTRPKLFQAKGRLESRFVKTDHPAEDLEHLNCLVKFPDSSKGDVSFRRKMSRYLEFRAGQDKQERQVLCQYSGTRGKAKKCNKLEVVVRQRKAQKALIRWVNGNTQIGILDVNRCKVFPWFQ